MAMLVSDQPLYTDLINNFDYFHLHNTPESLLKLKGKWGDDSDYSKYRTIEDLLENLTEEDKDQSHIVTVDIKDIFSSESSKSGCDRTLWSLTSISATKQQHESLNRKKMYREDAAQVLSAKLRPHPTKKGRWQVVKYIGNNRVVMKLLANCGESTRVLMIVTFHKSGQTQDKYIKIESDLHATDAGDRSGQNEQQKFVSGFKAQRDSEQYAYEFLKKHQYNYKEIMQQEGVEGSENWISISSLQGIKTGQGQGSFAKYGEANMSKAMNTAKKLCEITKETVIGATPIMAIALMYSVFTKYGKSQTEKSQPLFTDQQLEDFLIAFFKDENRDSTFGKKKLNVNDLSMTGSVKDIAYICGHVFWPQIVQYWMQINNAKIGFSNDCYASQKFLDHCKDKHLKKELRNAIA